MGRQGLLRQRAHCERKTRRFAARGQRERALQSSQGRKQGIGQLPVAGRCRRRLVEQAAVEIGQLLARKTLTVEADLRRVEVQRQASRSTSHGASNPRQQKHVGVGKLKLLELLERALPIDLEGAGAYKSGGFGHRRCIT